MLKKRSLIIAALISTLTAAPAIAADDVVAKVNGEPIPKSRVDIRVNIMKSQGQPESPQMRQAIRQELINLELLSQVAQKNGFDKVEKTRQQIEMAKQTILAGAYMQKFTEKHNISDSELRKEYQKIKTSLGNKEYKPRHILVKTKEEADAIIAKLKSGSSFESLASQSMDEGSKAKGGMLGWSIPSNFVPPFAQALSQLSKGDYTQTPVQSQFGWHVIMLEDERKLEAPSFEQVKPQIEQRLQQQAIQEHIAQLRAKAKIQ